ncbi:MAG: phosphate acyltransferase [Bacteroidetes bacterium]|nr:phosphate acyltransferase [Bacteroidota bacterium]
MRIGLDAMGGDFAPRSPVQGALAVLPALPADVQLVLYGQRAAIEAEAASAGGVPPGIELVDCPEVVLMEDHPALAMRQKPHSSIAVGLQHLAEGRLDAYISAGSTGAVTVGSIQILKLFEGLHRPAIAGVYPVEDKQVLILDCGANTDSKPEYLVEFAYIGHAYMKAVYGLENPRVGLLNIGEEPSKGNQLAKETHAMLQKHGHTLNFVGNVEGWDLNRYAADVFVCDGFTGNILMKMVEGYYPYLKKILPYTPELEQLNFERVSGLPLLGVQGNVIIGHGSASPQSIGHLVHNAQDLVRSGLVTSLPPLVSGIWKAEATQ